MLGQIGHINKILSIRKKKFKKNSKHWKSKSKLLKEKPKKLLN